MKTIYKTLAAAALAMPMVFTGCIEETFPTSGVTSEQVAENSKGLESVLRGMPAYMKKYQVWTSHAFDYGYPSVFCMLNVMTQDAFENATGYDWYSSWAEASLNINTDKSPTQVVWYYLNFMVQSTNNVMETIGDNPSNSFTKGGLAQALIFRASTYLDMARMYEFLPNDRISSVNSAGNDVLGLTVPIVTEKTSDEERQNNPRATHDQMLEFILSDLDRAIDLYEDGGSAPSDKSFPSLAVAYGIKARAYMWDEDYPKAAEFAQLAIAAAGSATPLTKEQWLDTTNGFNDASVSSWLWCIQQESNDDAVQSWTNWTSFMAPEILIGYAGGGSGSGNTYFHIDKSLYESIDNRDWRKLSFKAPEGHPLSGQEPTLSPARFAELEEYAGVKFRPGKGNMNDESTAFATALPLMRIEEMYFIKAEATAHSNPSEGKRLIEEFMQTYRYKQYTCQASVLEDVVNEIILQKRMEFWGENITFFDFKRLNMSVDRAYDGSNWPDQKRLVSSGRPGWMNFCILDYEAEFNKGVKGYLNPNVGGVYKPVQ